MKSRFNSGNSWYQFGPESFIFQSAIKNISTRILRTKIFPLLYSGVKLGLSHWGRNIGWGYLGIGCWGEYLDLRGTGGDSIMRSFVIRTLQNDIQLIKSRRMSLTGHMASMGEKRRAYKVLVRKPEGNRRFGRPKYRLGDNIKMDLQEIKVGWSGLIWLRIRTSGGVLCTR